MSWRKQIDWVRDVRDADIVALRHEGMTYRRIGAKVGLSAVMILKILRKYGEAPPPKNERDAAGGSARLAARIAAVHPERSAS